MPMFYTPKPRQFHYTPRFYDPQKEELENLKKKYAKLREAEAEKQASEQEVGNSAMDKELEYFERRVRDLDRKERQSSAKFGMKDLFRKREMPTFNYQPRFSSDAPSSASKSQQSEEIAQRIRSRRFARRFDIEDTEYFKPISGGKIMLYVGVVFIMLLWIFL